MLIKSRLKLIKQKHKWTNLSSIMMYSLLELRRLSSANIVNYNFQTKLGWRTTLRVSKITPALFVHMFAWQRWNWNTIGVLEITLLQRVNFVITMSVHVSFCLHTFTASTETQTDTNIHSSLCHSWLCTASKDYTDCNYIITRRGRPRKQTLHRLAPPLCPIFS